MQITCGRPREVLTERAISLSEVYMNEKYKYGELYRKYNMDGDIKCGTGMLRVHDIFNPIPEFMKQADVIFSDPPSSRANINSFYSKAEIDKRYDDFTDFHNRFFQVIDEIAPKVLFLEVFKANKDKFIAECEKRFMHIKVYNSMYYSNSKNKCWIIQASNEPLKELDIEGVDEEKVIEKICTNTEYNCIGDPCMGKGLVAFYANRAGKKFVGTELNKYRLAVCVERVTTNTRGKIN